MVAILGLADGLQPRRRLDPHLEERVLFVGTGETARKVARQILDQHEFAYRVVGFIDDDATRIGERIVNPAILGTAGRHRAARSPSTTSIASSSGCRTAAASLPIEQLLRAKMSGRPRRGRDDDLRAAHREDPDRRPEAELADLLRRLPRVAR